jgi:putative DNA primase/helicase
LRELGGDLSGDHPIMDGRPAGYAKNNRSGEETRWKSSAVSMSKEQFAAVAPTKIAEREADRAALYERTAERLNAQLEAYPALSSDHEYLRGKRIKLESGVYQTPRRSMAIPA